MKLLSITVPCYNSERYMRKCIDSLLEGGEEVEVIIVDDGSSDNTGAIADEYAGKYPSVVRVVHQENGGHGEAVNTGLKNASGLYFKVVDSDDWVNREAFHEILNTLETLLRGASTLDMLISNFVYEKEGVSRKKVMQYRRSLPAETMFQWNEIRHMPKGKYILMHSVIYRTQLLRDCRLELPKHTFYVDNLFVYEPLPFVKNMYYLDVNFYRYYIGREDQSVNETVMIRRIDQQLKVNKIMMDIFEKYDLRQRTMRKYMLSYLDIITAVSSIMLIRMGTDKALDMKSELWAYLKEKDRGVYYKLRCGLLGRAVNLPGKSGRKMSVTVYKICQKFYGFN